MNQTYCCSDLHGIYDLWWQIKNFCDDTDTIYFLGDAADRGPDGIKIIEELLLDKRVIYLRGNHEEFIINYAKDKFNVNEWMYNGGKSTYKDLITLDQKKRDFVIEQLRELPYYATYQNKKGQIIILSHAGLTPKYNIEDTEIYPRDLLWDRKHLIENWAGNDNTYIVHGHTPVQCLWHCGLYADIKEDSPCFYCEQHKIDLDIASFQTKKAILLNLNSFRWITFAASD